MSKIIKTMMQGDGMIKSVQTNQEEWPKLHEM